jgi:tetratricopeptide (TPR) repeat protein
VALLKCLDPLVSIGCALFGVPPAASALATGGSKIATLFRESAAKHGFDSEALIAKMQAAAFRAADRYDSDQDWRDAMTVADAALTQLLPLAVPTRDDMVTCAAQTDFAGAVQTLVLDRVSEGDARFGALNAEGRFCPRSFAGDIIRAVLDAALADEKYAQSLELPIQMATLRGVSEVKEDVAELKDDMAEVIAWVRAQQAGSALSDQALRGAISRFIAFRPEASDVDVLNAVETFEREYRALLEQVSHIRMHDHHIQSLKVAAEVALEAGDIATARRLYGQAAQDATEKLSEPVRTVAALRVTEARTALTMLDWHAADAAWGQAAAMLMPFDVKVGEAIVFEAAGRLYDFGLIFGQTSALILCERHWRTLEVAARERGDSKYAAGIQNNLGNVLRVQGERMGGDDGLALFGAAGEAYRAALTVRTQATMPADWAMTQNNLGIVLWRQGEWTGGDAGLALFGEAVAAYRAALTVRTLAAMPTDWAGTQNNLGNVLQMQGERTTGKAGLALLGQAVEAYRAALTVRSQASMPAQWAGTQNNLGLVLCVQGERTRGRTGLVLLREAVDAYRAALTIFTQAAMPTDWAGTQNNLGLALWRQGGRTRGNAGLALLGEAVEAYRAALTFYTQAEMPTNWATTQNNLGLVLSTKGARSGGYAGLALLGEAVEAYRAALTVYTPEHFSHNHEIASNNLALAEAAIAARRG